VRVAALLAVAASLGCASAPKSSGQNSPAATFRSERLEAAGLTAHTWHYVPLMEGLRDRVAERFDRAVANCLSEIESPAEDASAGQPDPGSGHSAELSALSFCMTQRGFYPSLCDDGLDNDGDGAIDYPDDPGCLAPDSIREDPPCDDGLDNDGDGLIDWDGAGVAHPDPECTTATTATEAAPRKRRILPF
jgi:hypothetical protein